MSSEHSEIVIKHVTGYIFCPSGLSLNVQKLYNISNEKHFYSKKMDLRLTLNSGLALAGFRTNRPSFSCLLNVNALLGRQCKIYPVNADSIYSVTQKLFVMI